MSTTLPITFDADKIKPGNSPFAAKAKGEYLVMATKSKVTPTQSEKGIKINWIFKMLGDDFVDQYICISNMVIQHEIAETQRRGQEDLAAICLAAGIHHPINDTSDIHGKPFRLSVYIEHSDGYEPRNKMTGARDASDLPKEIDRPSPPSPNNETPTQTTHSGKPDWA